MAWNLFQGAIYGFPVSGDPEAASVISLGQRGPMLMTGGAFGPEAGLLGCGAALLGIAVIAVYARRRQGGLRPLLAPRWLGPGLPGIPGSVPTMGSGRRA
jgi:hypothetical protein